MTTLIVHITQNKHENVCGIGCKGRNEWQHRHTHTHTRNEKKKKKNYEFIRIFIFALDMTGCGISAHTGAAITVFLLLFLFSILTHMQKSDAVNNFRSLRREEKTTEKKYEVGRAAVRTLYGYACVWVCERTARKMWNTHTHTLHEYIFENASRWSFVAFWTRINYDVFICDGNAYAVAQTIKNSILIYLAVWLQCCRTVVVRNFASRAAMPTVSTSESNWCFQQIFSHLFRF